MRAIHKYKGSKNKEHLRRIAQSMGYRITLWDMPHMVALCQRAGILDTIDLDSVNTDTGKKKPLKADTETIKL